MLVTVVNFDKRWDFARLVRQHCIDLYRSSEGVQFWNAIDDDDEEQDHRESRALWGDWPQWLGGNFSMLDSETLGAIDEIAQPADQALVFIWIFPAFRPDWPNGLTLSQELLDKTSKRIAALGRGGSSDPVSLVWRIGLFRDARPWNDSMRTAGREWLRQGLLDTIIVTGRQERTSYDDHDMAIVRAIVDLTALEDAPRLFRAGGQDKHLSILRATLPLLPPKNQVLLRRRVLSDVLKDIDAELTRRRQSSGEGDEGTLKKHYDAIIEKIDGRIRRSLDEDPDFESGAITEAENAENNWLDALKSVRGLPRRDLLPELRNARGAYLSTLSKLVEERSRNIDKQANRGLAKVRDFEDELARLIAQLSDGLVGGRGGDRVQIDELIQDVKKRIDELGRTVTERHKIIAGVRNYGSQTAQVSPGSNKFAAPNPVHEPASALERDLRLKEHYAAFEAAWLDFANTVHHLPNKYVLLGWGGFGIFAIFTIVLAHVYSAHFDLSTASLSIMRDWGILLTTFAFLISFGLASIVTIRRQPPKIREAREALIDASNALKNKAHEVYDQSICYLDETYELGVLNLLKEKLDELHSTLRKLDRFKVAVELLRDRTDDIEPSPEVFQNTVRALSDRLMAASRFDWLRVGLEDNAIPTDVVDLTVSVDSSTAANDPMAVTSHYFAEKTVLLLEPLTGATEEG